MDVLIEFELELNYEWMNEEKLIFWRDEKSRKFVRICHNSNKNKYWCNKSLGNISKLFNMSKDRTQDLWSARPSLFQLNY